MDPITLASTDHGQVTALSCGSVALEFGCLRLCLPRRELHRFRALVADLVPNPEHGQRGWRKDMYVGLGIPSMQLGFNIAEWLDLQNLLDLASILPEPIVLSDPDSDRTTFQEGL